MAAGGAGDPGEFAHGGCFLFLHFTLKLVRIAAREVADEEEEMV